MNWKNLLKIINNYGDNYNLYFIIVIFINNKIIILLIILCFSVRKKKHNFSFQKKIFVLKNGQKKCPKMRNPDLLLKKPFPDCIF